MQIKILDDRVSVPKRKTDGSAGFDLQMVLKESNRPDLIIMPGVCKIIETGISIYIGDKSTAGVVSVRSSLGKKGVSLSNAIGIIDSDYQGQILLLLYNWSESQIVINDLDRVGQIVFHKIETPTFEIVNDFVQTERGEGGFGSTGKT